MSKILNEGDLGDRMELGNSYGTQGTVDISSNEPSTYAALMSPNSTNIVTNIPEDPKDNNKVIDVDSEVDKIKHKITPDEVLCGIKYELKNDVLKDKDKAKQRVILNLKKDPHFYSSLHMLNIDDSDLTTEDYRTPQEKKIGDIIKEMWQTKVNKRQICD